jgi:hypothetical protein
MLRRIFGVIERAAQQNARILDRFRVHASKDAWYRERAG